MGIDHGVANLERHVTGTPSVAIQGNTPGASPEWRFRRSGHISGLDKAPRDVLGPGLREGYSQVGAGMRKSRNAPDAPSNPSKSGAKNARLSARADPSEGRVPPSGPPAGNCRNEELHFDLAGRPDGFSADSPHVS
ncbi:hypothetical protein GQS52_10800 [Streptomyces sp. SCUT-3]|nr:hypothetical protein C0036_11165 [Streptomyces sp. DJ]QMV22196.1 hypothetical protein GQS52_10800 [Streptomyces sp. SCUT-3]